MFPTTFRTLPHPDPAAAERWSTPAPVGVVVHMIGPNNSDTLCGIGYKRTRTTFNLPTAEQERDGSRVSCQECDRLLEDLLAGDHGDPSTETDKETAA